MGKLTHECIEQELQEITGCPMTRDNLKLYVLLCQAKEYMTKLENHTLTKSEAEDWVKSMNPPGKWTMDQTTAVMTQHSYSHNPCEFFAVMNAMWSDYGKTAAKYGADKPDFWADMAHDWLDDADAKPGKASRYYHGIVDR